MSNIENWQKKLQQSRKQTPYREFVKEIASWKPFWFYRNSGLISRYPETGRVKNIVSPKQYLEMRDNLPSIDYDADKTFFENLKNLFEVVPFASLVHFHQNENVDYSDCIFAAKNVYLSIVIWVNSENVFYSAFSYIHVSNVFHSLLVSKNSHNIYSSVFVGNSFKIFYSKFIQNSSDIWFSTNLIWCRECIFCDNLENVSYCIANKKLEKHEYEIQKNKILARTNDFEMFYSKLPVKATNYNSKNISGNAVYFSENMENGFYNQYIKDWRNVVFGNGDMWCHDFYDCFDVWINSDNFYGVCSAGETGTNHLYMSYEIWVSSHIFYSYHLENCSYCIGCVGLRNKHFCILNKQYSREEWFEIADKIFASMESEGTLWKFFPPHMNPFYFNDTMAIMLDPSFSKQEVTQQWYLWRDEVLKVDVPSSANIVPISQLFQYEKIDNQWKVYIDEGILKVVIQDIEWNYYRIIPEERDFLNAHHLPIPRMHWFHKIQTSLKSL